MEGMKSHRLGLLTAAAMDAARAAACSCSWHLPPSHLAKMLHGSRRCTSQTSCSGTFQANPPHMYMSCCWRNVAQPALQHPLGRLGSIAWRHVAGVRQHHVRQAAALLPEGHRCVTHPTAAAAATLHARRRPRLLLRAAFRQQPPLLRLAASRAATRTAALSWQAQAQPALITARTASREARTRRSASLRSCCAHILGPHNAPLGRGKLPGALPVQASHPGFIRGRPILGIACAWQGGAREGRGWRKQSGVAVRGSTYAGRAPARTPSSGGHKLHTPKGAHSSSPLKGPPW